MLTGVAAGAVGPGVVRVGVEVGVGVGVGGAGAGAMGTARIEAHCTAALTGATMAAAHRHVSIHLLNP